MLRRFAWIDPVGRLALLVVSCSGRFMEQPANPKQTLATAWIGCGTVDRSLSSFPGKRQVLRISGIFIRSVSLAHDPVILIGLLLGWSHSGNDGPLK
jgi:hypothetical protein